MRTLSALAEIETGALLTAFVAITLYRMLTGGINLRGLLAIKKVPDQLLDPGRVQLLAVTLYVALLMVLGVSEMRERGEVFVPGSSVSLYLLAGSETVYLSRKFVQVRWRNRWRF